MVAPDGKFVGINLGSLGAGGAFVSLNLGVEWDDAPVEPVIRGLSQSVGMPWGVASRLVRVGRIGWGEAPVARCQTSMQWAPSGSADGNWRLPWGSAGRRRGQVGIGWRASCLAAGASYFLPWSSQDRQRAGMLLRWGADITLLRRGGVLSWRALPIVRPDRALRWTDVMQQVRPERNLPWAHPWLTYRAAKLPWGPAKPLPWIVRPPPPKPDPDPDPDPVAPSGDAIPLNLGCLIVGYPGLAPINIGVTACYVVRPQRRTYVVINSVSVVRLPDRIPIQVESISISSSVDAWGSSYDIELADSAQLALLKPTAAGPRLIEINLNGYVWTAVMESYSGRREWSRTGATLAGRSRTALLAGPYAPGRVKATTEERSMAQLVDEELADTGFTASYDTVDWLVPPGAWFYDALPALDAISRLAEASGAVVQSDPAEPTLRVRARYPDSPWDWRDRTPAHVLQEDIITNESLQMRSAPLYDAVVVTGELAGKGVTCKVRRAGEAGQFFAQQVSSPLINTAAAGAERGRNILADRGEQAAIDLVVPLFASPLRPGEVGRILPLDLVEVVAEEGTWHGLCTAVRTEARIGEKAVVIEQTVTLERHYSDAD